MTASDGRESTFGRRFTAAIANNMPYASSHEVIDHVDRLNPLFKHFHKSGTLRDEALQRRSVHTVKPEVEHGVGDVAVERQFHSYMYANVDADKGKRLRDYRVMAAYNEVANALDEICNEMINRDDKGNIVYLKFRADNRHKIEHEIKEDLQKEFHRYIRYFDLESKGWEYFRTLLVDAELFFEHIIHPDHEKEGVLGVIQMPSELVDPIYDNQQNANVKGFLFRKIEKDPKKPQDDVKITYVPFDKNQVTYFHSHVWNEQKSMRIPFIENARRPYRQLSLIEDSIVIYRLVRAPERLVFNVDVGNMPPPKAEAYIRKLIQQYWSRRTYDTGTGTGTPPNNKVQTYNPQSMLDSFWFAKRAGSEGTSVEQLPGGANLGELTDLNYFVGKLYEALKVPTNRHQQDSTYDPQGGQMLREELRFAEFIVRMQQNFAASLMNGFVTHLKLTEKWKLWEMQEDDFIIEFNPPSNYYELRQQQRNELKFNNFNTMSTNESISNTFAQKRYLGFTDEEVLANREMLKKDAALTWELNQIMAAGPDWRKQMEQLAAQQAEGQGMPGGGGGMMPGGGGGMPPDFGPPPPAGDLGGEEMGPEAGLTPDEVAAAPAPDQMPQA